MNPSLFLTLLFISGLQDADSASDSATAGPGPSPDPIATEAAGTAFDLRDGTDATPTSFESLIDDLAGRDVVFLGELHDSTPGHRFQLEVVRALAQRRNVAVAMEMFERDVQGLLDDYFKNRIDEEQFLQHSRPWSNYQQHYRPVVEFAREEGLDVLAANVPRRHAAAISRGSLRPNTTDEARVLNAPKDQYYDRFTAAMDGHFDDDETTEALDRMYRAQCIKDDTMGESVAVYLRRHRHQEPLVVHLCGRFHSDYGLGTAARVVMRAPTVRMGIVSMLRTEDPGTVEAEDVLGVGHYVLIVPPEPEDPPPAETEEEPPEAGDSPSSTEQK